MFFNHGEGENGKGVFLETLAYIIGDYSYTSAFDTFVYHEKSNRDITRFLYQDEFSYKPNFKIWMSSNFRPSIRATDWGTWRRVKIIPWNFRVTQANRDEQLKSAPS